MLKLLGLYFFMSDNILITNFKTYLEATGENALYLAKIHEKVASFSGKNIAIAVQTADIFRVSQNVDIPVFAQHVDNIGYGANTGWNLPYAIKEAGATGVIINHSEHRFNSLEEVKSIVENCHKISLKTCVCVENDEEGKKISEICSPDFIAVEPPYLIGGDISISTAEPKLISNSVDNINGNVLVGAGIKTSQDIEVAIKLGAKGILLASGVVKSKNPEDVLNDLVKSL